MTIPGFADTPVAHYYAVIFSGQRTEGDNGYGKMAELMVRTAKQQPGCLGVEAARNPDGFGITVAYFTDEAAIAAWRDHVQHRGAQKLGKERWYAHYEVRVARVERSYSGPAGR